MIPGEYILQAEPILANAGKEAIQLTVVNTGDRPVQVGSHFHFFEVNKAFLFDREKAFGRHLDIPSGTAVRFEPGEEKAIALVDFSGARVTVGFNNLVDGAATEATKAEALHKLASKNFKNTPL